MTKDEFNEFNQRLTVLALKLPSMEEFEEALEFQEKNPMGNRRMNELSEDTLKLWMYFAHMNMKIAMEAMEVLMSGMGYGSVD